MTWDCQAGVEPAKLVIVIKHYKITTIKSSESIKLGIDAQAKWDYVAGELNGATPQPVGKMDFEGLLPFVARQKRLVREVYICYEASHKTSHKKPDKLWLPALVIANSADIVQ